MTLVLRLGVLDVPYQGVAGKTKTAAADIARHVASNGTSAPSGVTTGDVAGYLEDEYHVMENFFELHADDILGSLEEAIGDHLQDVHSGSSPSVEPFLAGTETIKTMFNKFIDSREMDSIGYPGVPTMAAKNGVNHRFKHPYAKSNPERPSFRDAGLYEASFRAEVVEK